MIVRITRAKVGHCQTPIDDTRLTAGVRFGRVYGWLYTVFAHKRLAESLRWPLVPWTEII